VSSVTPIFLWLESGCFTTVFGVIPYKYVDEPYLAKTGHIVLSSREDGTILRLFVLTQYRRVTDRNAIASTAHTPHSIAVAVKKEQISWLHHQPKSTTAILVTSGEMVNTSTMDLTKSIISCQLLPPGGSLSRILPELSITNAMSAIHTAIK